MIHWQNWWSFSELMFFIIRGDISWSMPSIYILTPFILVEIRKLLYFCAEGYPKKVKLSVCWKPPRRSSSFWKDVVNFSPSFWNRVQFTIGNGRAKLFWKYGYITCPSNCYYPQSVHAVQVRIVQWQIFSIWELIFGKSSYHLTWWWRSNLSMISWLYFQWYPESNIWIILSGCWSGSPLPVRHADAELPTASRNGP